MNHAPADGGPAALQRLLDTRRVWRGHGGAPSARRGLATGCAALDAGLPDGWPDAGLTEILAPPREALGLRLLLPALARLSRAGRWVMWIDPPFAPHAPALAGAGLDLARLLFVHPRSGTDRLWAVEQALRSGACGAVLAWLDRARPAALRRLQLAAEAGATWGVLFRPPAAEAEPAAAGLRLAVEATPEGGRVRLVRCPGRWAGGTVNLPRATPG